MLSAIVPVYNESDSLGAIYGKLSRVMKDMGKPYEMIFVDDGSTDATAATLLDLALQDSHVRVIKFDRNYGQSSALQAGFDHAGGEVLVTLDADMENNPADIPHLVGKLNAGVDVVCGRRNGRSGGLKGRCSIVGNALYRLLFKSPVHDMACTLRAYRKDALQGLVLRATMHRYLPLLLHWEGAQVMEMLVTFEPRKTGHSKYTILNRVPSVLRDTMLFLFFRRRVLNNTKRSYRIEYVK